MAAQPLPGPVRARTGRAGHRRRRDAAHDRRGAGRGRPRVGRWTCSATRRTRATSAAARAAPASVAAASCGSVPQVGQSGLRLLGRIGRVDPTSLDAYRASGGYRGARARDRARPGRASSREVTDSKLLGRGGAAFPTGRKWDAVAKAPARPHYLVCNADESEPGTFKDRVLMEDDPVRADRGDDHRRLRDRLRARISSTCAASIRSRPQRMAHARSQRRARPACSATTSWARAFASTSRSAAAPARTSAARRRRCSTRSRACAASRATSRPSRSRSGSSASRPS